MYNTIMTEIGGHWSTIYFLFYALEANGQLELVGLPTSVTTEWGMSYLAFTYFISLYRRQSSGRRVAAVWEYVGLRFLTTRRVSRRIAML
jgi:hypothetical protein